MMAIGFASISATANDGVKVDFEKQIKPIFENHCLSCHGPDKEEGFRIDVKDDALAYVEEESAEDSDLYLVLVSDDEEQLMPPPDDENPLTDEQIELVKTWINEGADWPDDVEIVAPVAQADDKDEEASGDTEAEEEDSEKEEKKAVDPKTQQLFNAIGSLHPAAVHLPIGLLLAAGLFAFLSLRGNFVMSDCAYYCLWVGTLGAIAACVSGWWFSPMEHRGTVETWADLLDQDHKVFWHRTGGLITTAVALLLALFAAGARNRDPDDGVSWKLGLILLAGGIGWVGHTGGELHYPSDHYEDLNGVINRVMGKEEAADGKKIMKDDSEETDDADSEEVDEVGKASSEL